MMRSFDSKQERSAAVFPSLPISFAVPAVWTTGMKVLEADGVSH